MLRDRFGGVGGGKIDFWRGGMSGFKKHHQTQAEAHVVHSRATKRGIRVPDGRGAGGLCRPPELTQPVLCMGETHVQCIYEVRDSIPTKAGQSERYDVEYERIGSAPS
jgi:hypothetical protein